MEDFRPHGITLFGEDGEPLVSLQAGSAREVVELHREFVVSSLQVKTLQEIFNIPSKKGDKGE